MSGMATSNSTPDPLSMVMNSNLDVPADVLNMLKDAGSSKEALNSVANHLMKDLEATAKPPDEIIGDIDDEEAPPSF